MLDFAKASDAALLAYKVNNRKHEIIARKQDILDSVNHYHNITPTSVLFIGFSSFIFASSTAPIYITCISDDVKEYLKTQNINFKYVTETELIKYQKKFQTVIASDEFFTYADSDASQKSLVTEIANLATHYILTTLRDYKNQDFKDKEFSQPCVTDQLDSKTIFLEYHDWDYRDRASWRSSIYAINQEANTMTRFGPLARRTMYFKQLAKFSIDAGADSFLVHKNLMYKGLVRKNYEHVITINFPS